LVAASVHFHGYAIFILGAPALEDPTRKNAQIFTARLLRVTKRDHTLAKLVLGSSESSILRSVMSKDGPPISSGYRYGTLNAFRANLPAEALKPRGVVTEADARARQNLSDFAAYPARAKSIGKPLPVPQGVSPRRAAVLNRIAELAEQENALRSVTISEGDRYILKLVFGGSSKSYRFYEEDLALGM